MARPADSPVPHLPPIPASAAGAAAQRPASARRGCSGKGRGTAAPLGRRLLPRSGGARDGRKTRGRQSQRRDRRTPGKPCCQHAASGPPRRTLKVTAGRPGTRGLRSPFERRSEDRVGGRPRHPSWEPRLRLGPSGNGATAQESRLLGTWCCASVGRISGRLWTRLRAHTQNPPSAHVFTQSVA